MSRSLPKDIQLPLCTAAEIVKALERAGFVMRAKTSGSHRVMDNAQTGAVATVVDKKGKPMPRGTLRAMLRHAGITPEEVIALLQRKTKGSRTDREKKPVLVVDTSDLRGRPRP